MSFIANHPVTIEISSKMESLYGEPLFLLLFTLFLLIASYTDMKTLKIPNWLNASMVLVRFALIPVIGFSIGDVVGAILGFFVLLIPAIIKMHKMGGDIKAMAVVGLFLGAYLVPVFLFLIIGYFALYVLIMTLLKKKLKNVPFAPFFLLAHLTLVSIYFLF